jgi:flagellar biosynthetic protein FliQ
MDVDQVVMLGRDILQEVVILAGPILVIAVAVSLIISILQVVTSLQDQTAATFGGLHPPATALFLMMPWMWRNLAHYTITLLSDFEVYLR